MTLQIYSTLTKDIRPFQPIHPGKVGMYVCGVTVYDYTHIGHGRTFVSPTSTTKSSAARRKKASRRANSPNSSPAPCRKT